MQQDSLVPLGFWPFWWGWGVNLEDLCIKCAAFLTAVYSSELLKELNVIIKKYFLVWGCKMFECFQ